MVKPKAHDHSNLQNGGPLGLVTVDGVNFYTGGQQLRPWRNTGMRQTVLGGALAADPIDGYLRAAALVADAGLNLHINATSTNPFIVAYAHFNSGTGPLDFIEVYQEPIALTGLTPNATNYILIRRTGNGTAELVATTKKPGYGCAFPASPVTGDWFFHKSLWRMHYYPESGPWSIYDAVEIGYAKTDGSGITEIATYAYGGYYEGRTAEAYGSYHLTGVTDLIGVADKMIELFAVVKAGGGYGFTAGQLITLPFHYTPAAANAVTVYCDDFKSYSAIQAPALLTPSNQAINLFSISDTLLWRVRRGW